ncbi:MAG: hypothetical protein ABIA04_09000 [Pseudomonadota bacterium]
MLKSNKNLLVRYFSIICLLILFNIILFSCKPVPEGYKAKSKASSEIQHSPETVKGSLAAESVKVTNVSVEKIAIDFMQKPKSINLDNKGNILINHHGHWTESDELIPGLIVFNPNDNSTDLLDITKMADKDNDMIITKDIAINESGIIYGIDKITKDTPFLFSFKNNEQEELEKINLSLTPNKIEINKDGTFFGIFAAEKHGRELLGQFTPGNNVQILDYNKSELNFESSTIIFTDIAINSQGNVYFSEWIGSVLVFDHNGHYKSNLIRDYQKHSLFSSIACDRNDNIYILDVKFKCIHKLNKEGKFIERLEFKGSNIFSPGSSDDMIVDNNGEIFILSLEKDSFYRVIVKKQ